MPISFQELTAEHFRVHDMFHMKFEHGITHIVGRNGAGKTSIVEAVYWVLTGKTLRNERKINSVIKYGRDYTTVELVFKKDGDVYRVQRTVSKSHDLRIWKNEVEITHGFLSTKEEILRNIIGLDDVALRNTIIFGQRMAKLLEIGNADKKKIFDNLFKLRFSVDIEELRRITVDMRNEIANELSLKHKTVDELEKSKLIVEKQVERILEANKMLDRQREKIEQEIKELTEKSKNIEVVNPGEPPAKPSLWALYDPSEYEVLKRNNDFKIKELKNRISKNNERIFEGTCPTCFQEVDRAHIVAVINRQNSEILSEIEKLTEENEELQEKIDELNERNTQLRAENIKLTNEYEKKLEEYNKKKIAYERARGEIAQINSMIESLRKKLDEIDFIEPPTDDLKEYERRIEELNNEITELEKELEIANYWAEEGFTDKGLKRYLIQYMIGDLNTYMEKYGNIIGIGVRLRYVNNKIEIICNLRGREVNYDSLSGGEKTRVEVVTMFAMYDYVSATASGIDTVFFDEIFENLDSQGADDVASIIDTMRDKKVYIISHREIPSLNAKELRL